MIRPDSSNVSLGLRGNIFPSDPYPMANEIGFNAGARKEVGINCLVVEAGHRTAVQSQCPCCDNQVGALKAAVPKCGGLRYDRIGEVRLHLLAAGGKQLWQLLAKVEIIANDDRDWGRDNLWRIARRGKRCKLGPAVRTCDPNETRRT